MTDNRMHLNIFGLGTGRHEASWRHPAIDPSADCTFESYRRLVHTAERGKFDGLFLADGLTVGPISAHFVRGGLEPLTLLAALAPVTQHIGLDRDRTTTYAEPFNVARQFASVDHLSGGRAGWNIVTSSEGSAAANFSRAPTLRTLSGTTAPRSSSTSSSRCGTAGTKGAIVADQASGSTRT